MKTDHLLVIAFIVLAVAMCRTGEENPLNPTITNEEALKQDTSKVIEYRHDRHTWQGVVHKSTEIHRSFVIYDHDTLWYRDGLYRYVIDDSAHFIINP